MKQYSIRKDIKKHYDAIIISLSIVLIICVLANGQRIMDMNNKWVSILVTIVMFISVCIMIPIFFKQLINWR